MSAKRAADSKGQADLLALLEAEGPWQVEQLQLLADLVRRIEIQPGVLAVQSPITAMVPQVAANDIVVANLEQRLQREPGKSRELIKKTLTDPLLAEQLVGPNQELALMVRLAGETRKVDQRALEVQQLIQQWFAFTPEIRVTVTGAPLITQSVGEQILIDLARVLILTVILSIVLLWVVFARIWTVLVSLLTVGLAIVWTIAAMAALDIPINLVTAIVPPLVMALGLAYAMHAVFAVSHARDVHEAVIELLTPLTVTGITTTAGLIALCLQSTPAVRQFGIAGSIGVICAVLSVLGVLCPLLVAWPEAMKPRAALSRQLKPIARRMAIIAIRKRKKVIVAGALVLALGALMAARIDTGVALVSDMDSAHPTRQSYERVAQALGGANSFEIVLKSEVRDGALLPDVLNGVEALQLWLREREDIASTQSLVDVLKRLNQLFSDDPSLNYVLPSGLGLAKQLLLVGGPPQVKELTDLNYTLLRIPVRTRLDDTQELAQLFSELYRQMETLPNGLNRELRGDAVELVATMDGLTSGQLESLSLATLGIFIVLAVLFSSFTMALRALLPNLLPVAIYFGLIGATGIALGPTTALVASIVLGIAVDDTLFYLVRFNHHAHRLANERRATQAALLDVIQPVTVTTVVIVSGFACLVTSSFQTQILFGILAAVTLVSAWVIDLSFTPALASRSSIVTLWDVLRLDLGDNPHKSIAMFRGLSARQARVFALLTELRDVPAGTRLIRRGDEAREMFIVIEGELRIWIEEGLELDRIGRGTNLGETGLFYGQRTANVSAETDSRLLVIKQADLQRVQRRYPRIAAQILHNLNKIQAEHLERVNDMLLPAGDKTS